MAMARTGFDGSRRSGEDIVLFGAGEERRDHVWIEDVAEIVVRVLLRRSTGVLNVATWRDPFLPSHRRTGCRASSRHKVAIKDTPRNGPMPHDGYRPFDVAATRAAFPDFEYTKLADGLNKVRQARGTPDMAEVDLLRALPKTNATSRSAAKPNRPKSSRPRANIGELYFDGPRDYGYGGYRYDGRWVPVARDMVVAFGLSPACACSMSDAPRAFWSRT